MAARAQILVVDDDHGFRAFVRAMLERDGFAVIEAATRARHEPAAAGRPDRRRIRGGRLQRGHVLGGRLAGAARPGDLAGQHGMLAVLRYTEGNSMNSANNQAPATATATARMRPPPARSSHRLPVAGTPYLLGAGDGQHLWFLGNLVTWKATGEQTHGRLTIAEFVHPVGFAPPLHRHLHEDEIFYILSGTAEFRCKGERLRAAVGDFVLLPVGEPHTLLVGNREPLHALQITTPSGFEHFAAAAGRSATERRVPDPAPLDQPALDHTATLHGMQILGPPPHH